MPKTNTKEKGFEEFIESELVEKNGFVKRLPSAYDKRFCVDKELVLRFVQSSQPKEWKKLVERHGEQAEGAFLTRLYEEVKERGLIAVLREGIADHGIRFSLAYFKPETGLNAETLEFYGINILSVTRQVKYSEKNENSLDMVLFLNGLPLFTIELKNQLTGQSCKNSIAQYKNDREPREPLFAFKRCLAHFAVDTELVFMTTKLASLRTRFLPFNKGDKNSAQNPVNSTGRGYKTAYLWEDVWTKDSVLDIVSRFVHVAVEEKEDDNGKKYKEETLIFPRYHQLDAVRRLVVDAREKGAGKNYLVQHSAGSGKSNTIAWLAHRLSELHTEKDAKVFDSVVVVTDRRILDRQLRETVSSFEQIRGTVKPIQEGSKELKEALESGEKIITTTLQKFPFIVDTVGTLPGKKFAVIIDEAHSSQSGEGAATLREVLNAKDLDEAEREQEREEAHEETTEDLILKKIRSRKVKTDNISFFAFTATPKQKTLELFGEKSVLDGRYYPFSLYSMKQAIEEGFIVDVLKNYTTYETYFALFKKIEEDPEYKKKKAERLMVGFVERHEHAIEKKLEAMVGNFRERIAKEIDGKAKAMIVTKSRLHAVRYKLGMDAYLKEHGLPYRALVAFSGTVKDGGHEYTEQQMNGGIPDTHTAEEFKKNEYKFLIVAEKFQTGFDQPLLTAMYVDKKLSDLNAVQTLSRLNRTRADKEEVFVLDFVNQTDDIKKAFQPYYTTTILSEGTNPNILHDLQRDVLNYKLFAETEVNGFVEEYMHGAKPSVINNALDKIVERFKEYLPEEQEQFKSTAEDFVRKYAFVAQIVSFEDTSLEKLYIFLKLLLKKLPLTKDPLPYEILDSINIDSYKVVKMNSGAIALVDGDNELYPMGGGGHSTVKDEEDALSKIIKDVNERFGTNFTAEDKVILNNLSSRLLVNKDLEGSIRNNSRDAAKIKFDSVFQDELIKMLNNHFDLYKKLDNSPELKEYVNSKVFDYIHQKIKDTK